MRCHDCGQLNPPGTSRCARCGAVFAHRQTWAEYPPRLHALPGAHAAPPAPRPGLTGVPEARNAVQAPGTRQGAPAAVRPAEAARRGDLSGRVTAVDGPHLEQPDFDPARVLAWLLGLLLVLIAPLALLRAILESLGGLPLLIALAGIVFALRWLSPMNLLAAVHLAGLFGPPRRRDENMVPVRYLRVRGTDDDAERVVRLKGELRSGHLMPHDLATFWGRWRGGMLCARRAYSHRTRTWVAVEHPSAWPRLAATALLLVLSVAYLARPLDLPMPEYSGPPSGVRPGPARVTYPSARTPKRSESHAAQPY